MCPRRSVKPPQILVEGVLVVWGTRIDRLPVPVLPQLDVRVVCHAPILGLVPLPAVIHATKRLLVVPYTPLNYSVLLIDNAPMQFMVGGVKRWWVACHSSKLPTNPDGQVNLNHVEENKRDITAILKALVWFW